MPVGPWIQNESLLGALARCGIILKQHADRKMMGNPTAWQNRLVQLNKPIVLLFGDGSSSRHHYRSIVHMLMEEDCGVQLGIQAEGRGSIFIAYLIRHSLDVRSITWSSTSLRTEATWWSIPISCFNYNWCGEEITWVISIRSWADHKDLHCPRIFQSD